MSVGTVRMLFCSWSGVAQEMQPGVWDAAAGPRPPYRARKDPRI